jgi:hypothetical protein
MQAVARITPSAHPEPALATSAGLAQGATQSGTPAEAPTRPQGGRALVMAGPGPTTVVDPAGSRPLAVFLAQLIATAQQAPQTRQRRRAEPNEANAIYAAVAAPAARMGRAVCQSL